MLSTYFLHKRQSSRYFKGEQRYPLDKSPFGG